jgi:anaerobic selenocysteine-containing dehydrogenase
VRPGTDYGFNLAVIHQIIKDRLYDEEFVDLWIQDFDALRDFVQPYTPEWAAQETGVDVKALADFTHELAEAKPAIIWHPGWMTARYSNSFENVLWINKDSATKLGIQEGDMVEIGGNGHKGRMKAMSQNLSIPRPPVAVDRRRSATAPGFEASCPLR